MAVPHVLVTDETEEMIHDASAGWGDVDLFEGVSHGRMAAIDIMVGK
jgi:hypothetical protein